MSALYYFFILFLLIYEVSILYNTQFWLDLKHDWKKKTKDKDHDFSANVDPEYILMIAVAVGYLLWSFIGLMTVNWLYILAFTLYGIAVNKWKVKSVDNLQTDATISIIVLLFIILNKYHFHIYPKMEWITMWFND